MNPMQVLDQDIQYVYFNSMLRFRRPSAPDGKSETGARSGADIEDCMKNLSKAANAVAGEFMEYRLALSKLHGVFERYFAEQGGWTYEKAVKAADGFAARGFESDDARRFAMFVRNMFLDDSSEWSRLVNCVGVSMSPVPRLTYVAADRYGVASVIFEDGPTGRQFGIDVPFTVPNDRKKRFVQADDGSDYNYPTYSLFVPDFNTRRTVTMNIYPRVITESIRKFVLREPDDEDEQMNRVFLFGEHFDSLSVPSGMVYDDGDRTAGV